MEVGVPRKERCQSFNFYPSDFLNDPNVLVMSFGELGMYVTLLCRAWEMPVPGILPGDESMLRRLVGCDSDEWEKAAPALRRCFSRDDGRWIQRRMVREYQEQDERVKRRRLASSKANQTRWNKRPISESESSRTPDAIRMVSLTPDSSILTPDTEKKKERPDPPAGVSARCLARLAKAYPDLDLEAIELKLLAYHDEHPFKRLDTAMINWCKTAFDKGIDKKVETYEPAQVPEREHFRPELAPGWAIARGAWNPKTRRIE